MSDGMVISNKGFLLEALDKVLPEAVYGILRVGDAYVVVPTPDEGAFVSPSFIDPCALLGGG